MEQKKELSPIASKLFKIVMDLNNRFSSPEFDIPCEIEEKEEDERIHINNLGRVNPKITAFLVEELQKPENSGVWEAMQPALDELARGGYVKTSKVPQGDIRFIDHLRFTCAVGELDMRGVLGTRPELVKKPPTQEVIDVAEKLIQIVKDARETLSSPEFDKFDKGVKSETARKQARESAFTVIFAKEMLKPENARVWELTDAALDETELWFYPDQPGKTIEYRQSKITREESLRLLHAVTSVDLSGVLRTRSETAPLG